MSGLPYNEIKSCNEFTSTILLCGPRSDNTVTNPDRPERTPGVVKLLSSIVTYTAGTVAINSFS